MKIICDGYEPKCKPNEDIDEELKLALQLEAQLNISDENKKTKKTQKKKKNRCNYSECKKKLGLMPFDCRCGMKFCSNHRNMEHNCEFDYKNWNKTNLSKENPKIISQKVEII